MKHEIEIHDGIGLKDDAQGNLRMNEHLKDGMNGGNELQASDKLKIGGVFHFTLYDKHTRFWRDKKTGKFRHGFGRKKDEWDAFNKVPNVELDHILATEFTSGAQITAWYIGLMNATPTVAAGDTMGSHAGWTEYTSYSQATRVAYTGVESGQAVTNSASPAIFTVNAGSTTVGGAFITSGSAISGSTGTLGPEAAFTGGNRSPANGDQIVVTYSLSAASVN
jgi:hypothetical protein